MKSESVSGCMRDGDYEGRGPEEMISMHQSAQGYKAAPESENIKGAAAERVKSRGDMRLPFFLGEKAFGLV